MGRRSFTVVNGAPGANAKRLTCCFYAGIRMLPLTDLATFSYFD
jgi:hypothetical protein